MGMIIKRKTVVTKLVPVGSDHVVAWAPIPDGGKLLSVTAELHIVGAEAAPTNQLSAYGVSAELVPVKDPDSALALDVLWDNLVTKPIQPTLTAGQEQLDYDWDTADATPDTEPGEVDLNDMLGLLDPTSEIFAPHLEWMSFAKGNPIATAAGTPDTYTPRDFKRIRSSRRLVADGPSYAMIAVSSPSLDNDEISKSTDTSQNFWAIMENVHNVMNDMWRMQTGLTETGAESPYDTISLVMGDWIAPDMINPSTSLLDPMQYTAFCIADWVIEAPDTSIPNVLDANNG